MSIDHVSRAKKAWPLLVRRARQKKLPYTYGELCAELGVHHRAASWFLGVIQRYCHHNKLPPLQALVVNKKTKLPGCGYDGSHRTPKKHERALEKVYEKKWQTRAPQFDP